MPLKKTRLLRAGSLPFFASLNWLSLSGSTKTTSGLDRVDKLL
jgi:hypothetical protein